MGEFDPYKIKEYRQWDLFLHKQQFPYIGRCYAWANREKAAKVTDMTLEEQTELFGIIIPMWDRAIRDLFQHDWSNVAILGNDAPHLHAHLIPRFWTPRSFYGIDFVDPRPKGNYAPYDKKEIALETLMRIKDDIAAKL